MASLMLRSVTVSNFDAAGCTVLKYDEPCDVALFNQMLGVSVQINKGNIGSVDKSSCIVLLCYIHSSFPVLDRVVRLN